ncbi:hypothetical protein V4890_00155 [Ralstonia solanacearum species complex bacterium KE056]|uniref:hypothetical protein n=1 Tax=Ralstonia solanacearum species complex bacterium KE056 TaxID=3119585 RepID=UPI002FC2AB73
MQTGGEPHGNPRTASAPQIGDNSEIHAQTGAVCKSGRALGITDGALIVPGNTLTGPKFKDGEALKTFDYAVANPPSPQFSLTWTLKSAHWKPSSPRLDAISSRA